MKGHGFVPGFYGTMRARLPLFALEAVAIVLIALVPFPSGSRREVLVAAVVFMGILTAAFLVPWERLP